MPVTRIIAAMTAICAFATLAACDDADKKAVTNETTTSTATPTGPLDADEVSKSLPGHLTFTATGAATINYDDPVDLRVVVINDEEVTPVKFVSVGIEKLLPLPASDAFRIAFDLTGAYSGKGTYELPAIGSVGSPTEELDPDNPDPNVAGRGLSKPYLTYSPDGLVEDNPGAAATAISYENPIEACTLVIGADDATEGHLECPKVADASGNIVAFTMDWRTT